MKRVIIGDNPGAFGGVSYGLWVSKPGKAATSSNANDFLVAPGLTNMLAVLTGYFATGLVVPLASISSAYGGTYNGADVDFQDCVFQTSVSHGLGYTPIVWHDMQAGYQAPTFYVTGSYTLPLTSQYIGAVTPYSTNGSGQMTGADMVNLNVVLSVDSSNVYLTVYGRAIVAGAYGSGTSNPAPSSVTIGAPIHYAVMNARIA